MQLIYLTYIVPGSILIPVLAYLSMCRDGVRECKILFLYLVISAGINGIAILLAAHNLSNLWLLHLYTLVEAMLLLRFFALLLTSPPIRMTIRALLFLFPIACLVNLWLSLPSPGFNTYPRAAEALIFILLSVCYWLNDDGRHSYPSWFANPFNWMISGLLLYFASSFFLFVFSNFLLSKVLSRQVNAIWDMLWTIHASLVLLMYLLFTIGFRKYKRWGKISTF